MKRLILGQLLIVASCAGCQSLSTANLGMSNLALPKLEMPSLPMHASADRPAVELPRNKDIELHWTMGKEMEKAGHDRDAIHCIEKVRALDPKTPGVSWKLGVLYARQEDFEKAMAEFQKALEAEPKNSDLLNDVGYGCYQCGKWEEAEKWFQRAIDANPQNTRAQVNLGLAIGQQGKFQAAFDLFRGAIGEANAYHNIGMLYMVQKRPEEAKAAFRSALGVDPTLTVTKAALEKLEKPAAPKADTVAAKPVAPPVQDKPAVIPAVAVAPPLAAPTMQTAAMKGDWVPPEWKPMVDDMPKNFELPKNFEPKKTPRTIRLSAPVPMTSAARTEVSAAKKPGLGVPMPMAQ